MDRYGGFELLRVRVARGVAWVTIDHPPINLLDVPLFLELDRLVGLLEGDEDVRVVGFESADPDFFIAHADLHWILSFGEGQGGAGQDEVGPDEVGKDEESPRSAEPNPFVRLMERIRLLPKLTIGVVAGIARGGGSELLLSLDVRYAARGRTRLAQPEAALGIIPGGGGTQRLARLVGRARALEIVLGCEDVDAETAVAMGYVNRVFADDDLAPFARRFAERVAALPAEAIRLAKLAVDAAVPDPTPGLAEESVLFERAARSEEARARMRAFLEAGGQTRDVEVRLGRLLDSLGR